VGPVANTVTIATANFEILIPLSFVNLHIGFRRESILATRASLHFLP